MAHLGVLGGEERGPGRSGSMWSQPLLPSAVWLLPRGFLGTLGWRDCAEVHFHPLQSSQSYLLSQIMCKPRLPATNPQPQGGACRCLPGSAGLGWRRALAVGLPAALLVLSPLPNQSGPQGPTYRARTIEGGWERLSTRGLNAALRSGTEASAGAHFSSGPSHAPEPPQGKWSLQRGWCPRGSFPSVPKASQPGTRVTVLKK